MSNELFVIDRKSELDEKEQKRVIYLRDQLSTAENLGLEAQAAYIKADIATIEGGLTTTPLTDAQMTIWRAWLPTAYTDIGNDKHHQLANYHFDRIPKPVLKLWQKHKESGLFERFEIWTPENHHPDPILVGVNGNARHLLARWDESDANLVSFDDIKRELVRRWYKNENIGGEDYGEYLLRTGRTMEAIFAAIVPVFASTLVVIPFVRLVIGKEESGFLVAIALMVAIAVGIFICVRRWHTRCCLASSKLMQAIAKDDSVQRKPLPASA